MAKQSGTTRTMNMLKEQGFVVPPGQERPPVGRLLRSDADIVRRLMAVKATALWVTAPEDQVPSHVIRDALARLERPGHPREGWLGRREQSMLDVDRGVAESAFTGSVGWVFEGAWALAWVLGYDGLPDLYGTMMSDERVVDVLFTFLPPIETDVDAWLDAREVARFEISAVALVADALGHVDAAARAGGDAVPAWFHPAIHGRVVWRRLGVGLVAGRHVGSGVCGLERRQVGSVGPTSSPLGPGEAFADAFGTRDAPLATGGGTLSSRRPSRPPSRTPGPRRRARSASGPRSRARP